MIAILRKELLLQWRTRSQLMAVFVFGAAALLLFSFASAPTPRPCVPSLPASSGSLWAEGLPYFRHE